MINKTNLIKLSKQLLVAILSFFSVLGILASIAIFNYTVKGLRGTDFGSRYTNILSEKTAIDGWKEYENYFNSNFDSKRQMGEFRRAFVGNELNEGKLKDYNKDIKGVIFQDGKMFSAEINPITLEVLINNQPLTWHWHWYNWLGIELDKVHRQTVEEMINSPLPLKK